MSVKQVDLSFEGAYCDSVAVTLLLTISPPGAVPDSLAAVIERTDAPETNKPPSKRRRLTDHAPRSLAQLYGVSESGVPNGFIPLARATLHLVCDDGLALRTYSWLTTANNRF